MSDDLEAYKPVDASNGFFQASNLVFENLRFMSDNAESAIVQARSTIKELSDFQNDLDSFPDIPSMDIPVAEIPKGERPDKPIVPEFERIGAIVIPELNLTLPDVSDIGIEDAPKFNPTPISVNIPDAPTGFVIGSAPDRPNLPDIVLPDDPAINMPSVGDLAAITIPDFIFPDLPLFDAKEPEFESTPPAIVMQWAEPQYTSIVLNDVRSRISGMLQGGTGIPPAVEQALFDRTMDREDQVTHKQVDEIQQLYSSRGYDFPVGAMVKAVGAALEQNRLKASESAREILIKAAEWEIENLRNAVQQGIALEGVLMDQFNNMANRSFEQAKLFVDAGMQLYNTQVTLFNARQSAYKVNAEVYQTKLQAELSKLEVFKAQIEGAKAKGELNEQTVRIYSAQVQAIATEVEIYKARMDGAKIRSETNKHQIDAYRVDIQAFAEKLNAEKVKYDVYETQVKAESAKIGILESEARAFAATVQAFESGNNVKIQGIRAQTDIADAQIKQFVALLDSEKARTDAELRQIQATTSAFQAEVGAYSAEVGAVTSERQMDMTAIESRLRNNLAYYEIELKKYDAIIQRMIQQAQIQSDAVKSAGTMAAQLAAGAMSATNVSASISGGASLSDATSNSFSRSNQYSRSRSASENHNYNYEGN